MNTRARLAATLSQRMAAALAALLLSASAMADWTAADLDTLEQSFKAGISAHYGATSYPWLFATTCTASNCFGSNPDSPYGYPNFGADTAPKAVTQLRASSALVLIMETPPPARYFGVTPYIFTRYYSKQMPRNTAATPGVVPVFESLGDTLNLNVVGTAGSPSAGGNPFSQLSVFVMTADDATYGDIAAQFAALGFPVYALNKIALPLLKVPLSMGILPTSDTYTLLLRIAYPNNASQMTDYIARAPIKTVVVTPQPLRVGALIAPPISRIPGDGQPESSDLSSACDQLVEQLTAQFGDAYAIAESDFHRFQTTNYFCVTNAVQCNGDNPDALYTTDASSYVPASLQDRILIVGVNHVLTNKATYLSHSIVNHANQAGVKGINDAWLDGTALTMAGITNPADPRYATYQQLYAFTISYDCGSDPACVTVPQPTPDNPQGIQFGNPLDVTGRIYLDPATNTRPSIGELKFHRVFVLTKK
jgi:hypothetical protein